MSYITYRDGANFLKRFLLGGTEVTATAPELNQLHAGGTIAQTVSNAAASVSASKRVIYGKYVTGVDMSGAGNMVGVRGEVTATTAKSLGDGNPAYAYGVQGKLVADGATINAGSGDVCGVLAQISGSGTTVTSGYVAGLIVSGQSLPASANVDMIYAESGGNKINAIVKANVKADYFLDITNFETAGICSSSGTCTTPGQAHGWIKINVDGAVRYIALSAAVS